MKETGIKLNELGVLKVELLGNEDRSFKGLLSEELTIKQRYWIDRSLDSLLKEIEILQKSINKLIEKHGEDTEGSGKSINPESEAYNKFLKEYNSLIDQEIKINLHKFTIDEFDFKSNNHYHLFFKYFIEENE